MELFVASVALLALIKKFVDFSKYITSKDINGIATQLFVWASGVLAVWLYAQTDWADTVNFGGLTLAQMNGASLIALGLGLSSTASLTTDFIKSRDSTDSAAMPALFK